jgi:hypothetical protein
VEQEDGRGAVAYNWVAMPRIAAMSTTMAMITDMHPPRPLPPDCAGGGSCGVEGESGESGPLAAWPDGDGGVLAEGEDERPAEPSGSGLGGVVESGTGVPSS